MEGSTIERLWEFARHRVDPFDDYMKNIVWRWLRCKDGQLVVGVKSEKEDGEAVLVSS